MISNAVGQPPRRLFQFDRDGFFHCCSKPSVFSGQDVHIVVHLPPSDVSGQSVGLRSWTSCVMSLDEFLPQRVARFKKNQSDPPEILRCSCYRKNGDVVLFFPHLSVCSGSFRGFDKVPVCVASQEVLLASWHCINMGLNDITREL